MTDLDRLSREQLIERVRVAEARPASTVYFSLHERLKRAEAVLREIQDYTDIRRDGSRPRHEGELAAAYFAAVEGKEPSDVK